jgi:UDP-N-acetylglucosamine:LPS N-acetylglucosamine transferase
MIMNVTGLRKLRLFLGSFFDAFRLVAGNSFSAFVGLGSYLCIPVFLFARLRRTRCIFIESYIRIDDLSISGRIVYWLRLADRVYVRHSTIKRKYPRAVLVE